MLPFPCEEELTLLDRALQVAFWPGEEAARLLSTSVIPTHGLTYGVVVLCVSAAAWMGALAVVAVPLMSLRAPRRG